MRLKGRGVYSHNCKKLKKLICSRQKYQENLRIAEHIDSYPNVDDRTPLAIITLNLTLNKMKYAMKALLVKQETE